MTLEEIHAALQEQLAWLEKLHEQLSSLTEVSEDALTRELNSILEEVRTGPLSDVGAHDAEIERGTAHLILYDAHETPYASIDTPQLASALADVIRAGKHRDSPSGVGSGVVHNATQQEHPRSGQDFPETPPDDGQGL